MDLSKEQNMDNLSSVSEFLLLEFSDVRELQILHFIVFLIWYLAAITGNLLTISAIAFDHQLHTPMYFFLINLAIQDIGQVSVIIPKSMINSLLNNRHISYSGCVTQVLFFVFLLASDFFLLTVMAYDRYVAICNPLQYHLVMNRRACTEMVASIWVSSFLYGVLHTSGTFSTPFCANIVNQFFCEIPQLLKLSCSEINQFEAVVLLLFTVIGLGCVVFIAVTYVHIFTTVLTMPSVQGRQKVLSTCLPHLIVFFTFVSTGFLSYISPIHSSKSLHLDLIFSAIYSMVPPLLNPVIYSIRNKDIKAALSNLLGLRTSSKNTLFSLLL